MHPAHIHPFDTGLPATYGFRIKGEITNKDMTAMAERVLDAFDSFDTIDMLLVFDNYEGSETGAALSTASLRAQARALPNVRAYVVASAPESAGHLVETLGNMMPVDAKSFETEAEAHAYLTSLPRLS